MSLKREAMGFALAPLPVAIPLAFLFGFILLDRPHDGESVLEALLQLILGSYGAALLIGLPIHFVLRGLGRYSLLAYLGATALSVAAIVGIIAISAGITPASVRNPHGILSSTGLNTVLIFAALSLACTSVFWWVSVRRRHL